MKIETKKGESGNEWGVVEYGGKGNKRLDGAKQVLFL